MIVALGEIQIDTLWGAVERQRGEHFETIELTPIEYRMLLLMCLNPTRVVTKSEFAQTCFRGQHVDLSSRRLDTHMAKLRTKLLGCGVYIVNVHATGWYITVTPPD